jgi:hypothetical protein
MSTHLLRQLKNAILKCYSGLASTAALAISPCDVAAMTRHAAHHGRRHILQWLLTQGAELAVDVIQAAATGGQLRMCQHLRSIGCAWNESVVNCAAEQAHVNVIVWLLSSGCPYNDEALLVIAACSGSIALIQFALRHPLMRDDDDETHAMLQNLMLFLAGASGKLAAAKWLRQQGKLHLIILSKACVKRGPKIR